MPDPTTFVEPVADIRKSTDEEIRVTIEETRRGKTRVKVREWFRSEGELRPGRDGIALRPDLLDQIIAALTAANLKIRGRGAL